MSSDYSLNTNKQFYDFFLTRNNMRQFDVNSTRACEAIDCNTDGKENLDKVPDTVFLVCFTRPLRKKPHNTRWLGYGGDQVVVRQRQ